MSPWPLAVLCAAGLVGAAAAAVLWRRRARSVPAMLRRRSLRQLADVSHSGRPLVVADAVHVTAQAYVFDAA